VWFDPRKPAFECRCIGYCTRLHCKHIDAAFEAIFRRVVWTDHEPCALDRETIAAAIVDLGRGGRDLSDFYFYTGGAPVIGKRNCKYGYLPGHARTRFRLGLQPEYCNWYFENKSLSAMEIWATTKKLADVLDGLQVQAA
jgi:hypothetical protein